MSASPACILLFVAGDAPRSLRARERLIATLAARGAGPELIEIVDVLVQPQLALEYRVFASPVLTTNPPGRAVLYGDLSDTTVLERFLDGVLPAKA